jgi:putative oxidoreductase
MNTGLLILRLVLGALLIGHGSQKLFGSFGGGGLDGTGGFFHSLGFRPGRQMALVAGVSEAGAGLLLVLGLVTPIAAAAVIGTLFVAASVHAKAGLWAQNGGFELPLFYSVTAAVLAFTGPGTYSLDNVVGLDRFAGSGWGVLAIAVGALAGFVVVSRARRTLTRDSVTETSGSEIYPIETDEQRVNA